jgi:hypothetical protein
LERVLPQASVAEVAEIERSLGIALPDSYKQLLQCARGFWLMGGVVQFGKQHPFFHEFEPWLEGGRRLPAPDPRQIRARVLPVWWTDLRNPPAGDPIGCPVTVDEMLAYIKPLLSFEVLPGNLKFIKKGQVDAQRRASFP